MSDENQVAAAIAAATGRSRPRLRPLAGGCIAQVYRADFAEGPPLVAKFAPDGGLEVEAFMLTYLAEKSALPVPAVHYAADSLLLLEYVETGGRLTAAGEAEAADDVAALHGIAGPAFGFERTTAIGALPQPNPWHQAWIPFFREARLLAFARLCRERGQLGAAEVARLEHLAGKLEDYLEEPAAPALIHGDLWGGNLLIAKGRVAAYIDPAIHFAHPEVELAFTTLFSTFGRRFYDRYGERRGIAPGFFECRRDLYNLYPLLVHAALFGGHYPGAVMAQAGRFL